MLKSKGDIKKYFITVPAHEFLHIENRERYGYMDFWQKQSSIPEQDYDTICGLLDSVKGKLDDDGSGENSLSGQIMAYINDEKDRLCSRGFLRTERYGVRLPADHSGKVPEQMSLTDIPED